MTPRSQAGCQHFYLQSLKDCSRPADFEASTDTGTKKLLCKGHLSPWVTHMHQGGAYTIHIKPAGFNEGDQNA